MSRDTWRSTDFDAYVECTECGRPLEHHVRPYAVECPTSPWTVRDVQRIRREEGLPGKWTAETV